MKYCRTLFVSVIAVACFGLVGFKKHMQNQEHSTKKLVSQSTKEGESKQPKLLDLTVPLRAVSFERAPENLEVEQNSQTDSLSIGDNGKPRIIDVNGHLIMSQEPEAGKIKSADGAGIMINLHH